MLLTYATIFLILMSLGIALTRLKVFSFNNTIEAYKYLLEYDVMGKIVVEIDSK